MSRLAYILLLAMLMSGCESLPNKATAQIDNRRVEYALSGNGGKTVVFENGLGGTMDWWAKVLPELGGNVTAFAYNRPGYGNSEPASTPRDGQHIAEELRLLLRAKHLPPPYILVGHSLGGLYMQLFARLHPDEVSALILVDSTHPEQLKGNGAYENRPLWVRMLFQLAMVTSDVTKQELRNAVLASPTFAGKPVLVLGALQPLEQTSPLADDSNAKRRDLVRLYPGAKQIWVDSGHGIPLDMPDSVVAAIGDASERH
ncbi:alpha/beta fold hydrolase [Methylomonas rapida]|uniref:Alpha/beta hydrolase n=1 Tax=Methylomonas rapida TaxID=2963939 RepID=A0ABY7GP22_9GAMM|nr:alpha/beta hydrolase [Methylomonas rapida]WAR46258.1 alpha/beta hydrolase [Methylomonas rapida]